MALAPVARAASAKTIVALLNAQRKANGIPAGITENSTWSAACQAHNAYEHANNAFGHEETEGKRGYSAAGNLIARVSSYPDIDAARAEAERLAEGQR